MNHCENESEIYLHPGEYYFGDRTVCIRTILGSCVALIFWHPTMLIGGMFHYMLPARDEKKLNQLDGRYADEAMELAMIEIKKRNTVIRDYKVVIFGGGNMFFHQGLIDENHVGVRNVAAARLLVKRYGLDCVYEHVGGSGYRKLVFDVWKGVLFVKYADRSNVGEKSTSFTVMLREK